MAEVGLFEVTKAFGARPLFKDLTFSIGPGERIGLIGPNGAGKSTLLKVIAGLEPQDSGIVSIQKGYRISLLDQVPVFEPGATVLSALSVRDGVQSSVTDHDYDWEMMAYAQEIMSRLSLDKIGEDKRVAELSGGQKKRLALGRALMKKPDLLLLDEPTNHLDLESVLWLEDFLENAPFSTMTITHDRLFLQNVANRIIELNPRHKGGILSVSGDYTDWLEKSAEILATQERQQVTMSNTLRRETQWLRQGAKARTTKQQARIKRAGELKEQVEELGIRNQTRVARLDFESESRKPKKLIEAKSISKSYGDRVLFSGLDLLISPGTRIGLLGQNGCGKSTLIKVLLGEEKPTQGEVKRADLLSVAYFDQAREQLDPEVSLIKTLCPTGDYVDYRGRPMHVRSYLGRFLFKPEQIEMKVGKLSGGEQGRLLMARLMLRHCNVLVLDEPTNDLDLETLEVLEGCLKEFDGAVILVSHDRYFLDQVSNKIIAFSPKGNPTLTTFSDLFQWQSWYSEQLKGPKSGGGKVVEVKERASGRKINFNEKRELGQMEAKVADAERKLANLAAQSQSVEITSDPAKLLEIVNKMSKLQSEIDALYLRWSELEKLAT